MFRTANLIRLQTEEFDLCIIGSGASGAGCALDAALRGLKVALIDRSDFAAETSSKSTKLVHGGVRYLEQAFKKLDMGQLRQVRHGLEERHIVLNNAPHLAHPLGLITPVFSWWEGLYFYLGLRLYDLFAARADNLPKSRWLSKKEVLAQMPGITKKIHSAVLYYDGQLDDARYCLSLVQSASEAGAVVANYVEVLDFQKDNGGIINAATVQNKIGEGPTAVFSLKAKQFLNCTGPFSDNIRAMANPAAASRISPSKGVHLVLPLRYFDSIHAMLIPKTPDGRVVFAIPFEGSLLLGTTDEPCPDLVHEPVLESDEVDFLLETLQRYVSENIDRADVRAGFGGLRPLVASRKKEMKNGVVTKTLLRDHEVEFDTQSGLVSLMGGKWTTYRLMAKDAIDFICQQFGKNLPCTTESHVLAGATLWEKDLWKKIAATFSFNAAISQHLAAKYGTRAEQVAVLAEAKPELGERILPNYPFIKAEVVYAAKFEMAVDIRDFLARRIRLEFIDWEAAKAAAPAVGKLMGETQGWSEAEQQSKIAAYIRLINDFQQYAA